MLKPESQPVVLTVGHSTRPLETFINLLKAHAVTRLIDVRTVPRSRHNPQFNQDTFSDALESVGIRYTHAVGLGGFRRTSRESPNRGWRNEAFRGYADYMQTTEFAENLASLIEGAKQERVVLMCAEAVPWRCHRSLIADALLVHGGSRRRNRQRDASAVACDHTFRQGGRHVNHLSTLRDTVPGLKSTQVDKLRSRMRLQQFCHQSGPECRRAIVACLKLDEFIL